MMYMGVHTCAYINIVFKAIIQLFPLSGLESGEDLEERRAIFISSVPFGGTDPGD